MRCFHFYRTCMVFDHGSTKKNMTILEKTLLLQTISWSAVKWCQDNSSNVHPFLSLFDSSRGKPWCSRKVINRRSWSSFRGPVVPSRLGVIHPDLAGYSWQTRVQSLWLAFPAAFIYIYIHLIHLTNTTILFHQTHQPKKHHEHNCTALF